MAKLKYVPDHRGVRELAQSAGVGNACYEAGLAVERAAKAVPITGGTSSQVSSYRAAFFTKRADVTMAKTGEKRAGAFVMNDHKLEQLFGGRSRTLYSALQAVEGVTFN